VAAPGKYATLIRRTALTSKGFTRHRYFCGKSLTPKTGVLFDQVRVIRSELREKNPVFFEVRHTPARFAPGSAIEEFLVGILLLAPAAPGAAIAIQRGLKRHYSGTISARNL
jgi:hypothetical protein